MEWYQRKSFGHPRRGPDDRAKSNRGIPRKQPRPRPFSLMPYFWALGISEDEPPARRIPPTPRPSGKPTRTPAIRPAPPARGALRRPSPPSHATGATWRLARAGLSPHRARGPTARRTARRSPPPFILFSPSCRAGKLGRRLTGAAAIASTRAPAARRHTNSGWAATRPAGDRGRPIAGGLVPVEDGTTGWVHARYRLQWSRLRSILRSRAYGVGERLSLSRPSPPSARARWRSSARAPARSPSCLRAGRLGARSASRAERAGFRGRTSSGQ